MIDLGHDPSSVELPPPPSVVEDPHFAVGAHARGPILSIVVGSAVICNLRVNTPVAWALSRALRQANEAQLLFELRMQQREQRG
jgi:hypothetical protein